MTENIWKLAVQNSGDGVIDWDRATDRLFLKAPGFGIVRSLSYLKSLVHPEDASRLEDEVAKYEKSSRRKPFRGEYRFKTLNNRYLWLLFRGKFIGVNRFIGEIENISRRKKEEKRFVYEVEHDPLTGAYRRDYFEKKKNSLKPPFSVLVIDINGLKKVNDKKGHLAGDKLIVNTADFLQSFIRSATVVRDEDFVVRWGGDEFVVVLNNCLGKNARIVVQRLQEHAAKFPNVSFSVGAGSSDQLTRTPTVSQVLKLADKEMYKRKRATKARL